jgi:hypothetical protein
LTEGVEGRSGVEERSVRSEVKGRLGVEAEGGEGFPDQGREMEGYESEVVEERGGADGR